MPETGETTPRTFCEAAVRSPGIPRHPNGRRRTFRFSLLEIVVASFLMAMVLLPIVAMMVHGITIVREAAVYRSALGLADLVLSEAVAGRAPPVPDSVSRTVPGEFKIEVNTAPCPGESRLELVTVTVSWSETAQRTRSVSLKALRRRATGKPHPGPLPPIPGKHGKRRR